MGKSAFFASGFHVNLAITGIIDFENFVLALSVTVECGFALDIIAEATTKSLIENAALTVAIFSVFAGVLFNALVFLVNELSLRADRFHDRPTIQVLRRRLRLLSDDRSPVTSLTYARVSSLLPGTECTDATAGGSVFTRR